MMISNEMGIYDYGVDHPMKPERISMVFDLIRNFDLSHRFKMVQAKPCTIEDLLVFHDPQYVKFMNQYDTLSEAVKTNHNFGINLNEDVPGFPNFFNFAKLVAGSSIHGANILA